MRVGLFIPCYIDQFYPRVGLATVEVLQRHGCEVEYPTMQTCCGQPMANTGCTEAARPLAEKYYHIFRRFEYVVAPSGSCVSMVKHHYDQYLSRWPDFARLRANTYELCQFLTDVVMVQQLDVQFPYRVGLHQSCHGLRELRSGPSSEVPQCREDKPRSLLQRIAGLELSELERPDECCGFGGTFAVAEEAVSCMMGRDRLADHQRAGTQVLTATDMSCLMHLEGLLRRDRQSIRVMHIAEILAGHAIP
jgi:L-lactate dehydrogenase complex protein LldE